MKTSKPITATIDCSWMARAGAIEKILLKAVGEEPDSFIIINRSIKLPLITYRHAAQGDPLNRYAIKDDETYDLR